MNNFKRVQVYLFLIAFGATFLTGCKKDELMSENVATSKLKSTASLTIGASYQGGVIGYLDATGIHGLVISGTLSAGTTWANAMNMSNWGLPNSYIWYLPSKDELNQLYLNRTAIGNFYYGGYWSSSSYSSNDAWLQNFYSGMQSTNPKYASAAARAVHSF